MKVIIVESSGKIQKIKQLLQSKYKNIIVLACNGHIQDLDPSQLSIDLDNNYKPHYIVMDSKKQVIKNIKQYTNDKNNEIYIASDGDREGAFICQSIIDIFKLKKYKRIIFYEITQKALINAMQNPVEINQNLCQAQQTRRILDRIVGYQLSPLLRGIVKSNQQLGAGRVQSVIVKLIIDKENEINEIIKNYNQLGQYEFYSQFNMINVKQFKLYKLDTQLYFKNQKYILNDLENIKSLFKILHETLYWDVSDIQNNQENQYPNKPFITSTLQQEAFNRFNISPENTMKSAQKLYELGLITYMRTDSTLLSEQSHEMIKKYIVQNFGIQYYNYKQYQSNIKNAQEAHECIRPTFIVQDDQYKITINELWSKLQQQHIVLVNEDKKIYQMIWNRTIECQMKPVKQDVYQFEIIPITCIFQKDIQQYLKKIKFMGNLKFISFHGFKVLYNLQLLEQSQQNEQLKIQDGYYITCNEIQAKQLFQKIPLRYNEASLIKKLEKLGIGRPSTYSTMMNKIQIKKYVDKIDIDGFEIKLQNINYNIEKDVIMDTQIKNKLGKQKNILIPTQQSYVINDFLIQNFPNIMDYQFTSKMEDKLDDISNGQIDWIYVLDKFYGKFSKQINEYKQNNIQISSNNKQFIEILLCNHETLKKQIFIIKSQYGYALKMQYKNKQIYSSIKDCENIEDIKKKYNSKKASDMITYKINYKK